MPLNYIEVLEKLMAHKRWVANDPTGERIDVTAENLDGMNLSNQIMSGGIFTAATLEGALLSQVLATGANFNGCAFANADFSDSVLVGCSFIGADLTGADMRNAILDDADFTAAVIDGVDFRGASVASAKLPIPIYTFGVGSVGSLIEAVATPTTLQLDAVILPWSDWTEEELISTFVAKGLEHRYDNQYLDKVEFFKQLLRERGYTI